MTYDIRPVVMQLFANNIEEKMRWSEIMNYIQCWQLANCLPEERKSEGSIKKGLYKVLLSLRYDENLISEIYEPQNSQYFLTEYGKKRLMDRFPKDKLLRQDYFAGVYKPGDKYEKFEERVVQHFLNQNKALMEEGFKESNEFYLASSKKLKSDKTLNKNQEK